MKQYFISVCLLFVCATLVNCKGNIKEQQDEIYSRHLQEHIKLTIISTPVPDNKSRVHLLLLNDGQDVDQLGVKKIVDSLYSKNLIEPLVIVAIHAGDRMQKYGVSNLPDYKNNGAKADKYASFIDNELYAFIKKKAGVRKFKTVCLAGCSLGGLSAFDIAWDHADKIDKVGVFSGSFWWRDKDVNDKEYTDENNRIMLKKIKSSRKKPKLKYWLYAGAAEENADRDKDGISDVVDDTKDLVEIIKNKKVAPPSDIVYVESAGGKHEYASWQKVFPEFLIWAFKR
ncbi:MAG: alpha/beta hydrolase-fold protein [Ferruginibacter sp.]